MATKITQVGQPCRKCNTPVVRKEPKSRSKGAYYFAWYLSCPDCKTMYMVEEAKVYRDEKTTKKPERNVAKLPRQKRPTGKPDVIVYTDGGALTNPGRGGYGVVLRSGDAVNELSAGYERTTNNRMELLAAIAALESIGESKQILLYSDSKYLVDGITKGWARRWQASGWMRTVVSLRASTTSSR